MMNNMKILQPKSPLVALLIIIVAAVIGSFLFKKTPQSSLSCVENYDSARTLVNEMYSSVKGVPFDEYFYSPELKTCVAGIVKLEDVIGENKIKTSYLILDTINNKELWFALGTQYIYPQNDHEENLTQKDMFYQTEYNSQLSSLR